MSLAPEVRRMVEAAVKSYGRSSTPSARDVATKLMKDPATPAVVLFIAARLLLGSEIVDFEPETLWLELDPPEENRAKLGAALALARYPSFYWDYRVFGHTALAFSNQVVHGEEVPRVAPENLAWAVLEAETLFALTEDNAFKPHFDETVEVYTAATLSDAGFAVAPETLSFADEVLAEFVTDKKLRAEVLSAVSQLDDASIESQKFEDSAKGVQLARLAEIHVYLVNRLAALTNSLQQL